MVWKEQHFARELERQLVEIVSIRKRVLRDAGSQDPEIVERLDRLELSHRHLLRKLLERVETRRRGARKPETRMSRALRLFQTVAHENLLELVTRVRADATVGNAKAASTLEQAAPGRPGRSRTSRMTRRCGACGKLLQPGLLGPGDVIFQGRQWYHRGCVPRGQRFSRRGPWN